MAKMSLNTYLDRLLELYEHKELCKVQILAVSTTFTDLRPTMQLVHLNGQQIMKDFNLCGTIPVLFRGSQYNIPISIFLHKTYPYVPPLVYVRPTVSMVIVESRHVDSSGRVYLPYLAEWKHNSSDLITLVQILCCTFTEKPPVAMKRPCSYHGPMGHQGVPTPLSIPISAPAKRDTNDNIGKATARQSIKGKNEQQFSEAVANIKLDVVSLNDIEPTSKSPKNLETVTETNRVLAQEEKPRKCKTFKETIYFNNTQASINTSPGHNTDVAAGTYAVSAQERKVKLRRSIMNQLKDLKELRDACILDDDEFTAQKDKLLKELSEI